MSLVICGDSFFSLDKEYPGKHFSELLSKKLDLELINLARNACSNPGIRLQIAEAIKLKPTILLIGATTADRLEFPIQQNPTPTTWNNWGQWLGSMFAKNFDPKLGWGNVGKAMEINSINTILFSEKFNPYFVEVIRDYCKYIYDQDWKSQCDQWILNEGLMSLTNEQINFYFAPNGLQPFNAENFKFVDPKRLLLTRAYQPQEYTQKYPTKAVFHCDEDAQKILADEYYQYLTT